MKTAICMEPGKIIVRDVSTPTPGAGEVLVKVKACGISGSDVKVYQGKHPAAVYPMILGHEFSGEVVALGADVENLEIEDAVIVEPMFPCGECSACLAGDYNLCGKLAMLGYQVPGAFAEYALARAAMVYPKVESLSFEEAVLIEPLAVAVHAVRRARINVGDTVVVLGAGTIGLLVTQVAKKAGATVLATDLSNEKLHLAASLKADYVMNAENGKQREMVMAMTKDRGADIVMECAGVPQTMIQTVDLVRPGGNIVTVGWTGDDLDQMPMTKIALNEINLLGSSAYCRDFPTAIELAVSREVNFTSLISHVYELDEIGNAFEELSRDQHDIVKGIVKMSEQEDEIL